MSSCRCCRRWSPFRYFEPDDVVRATSSRFLSRCGFISYKLLLSAYFVFWTIYWPVEDNVDDAYLFATYWTFYLTAVYFLVSTTTAFLIKRQKCGPKVVAGPVGGTSQIGRGHPLSSCARFLLGLQVFTWNVACIGSIIVVVFWSSLRDGGKLTTTDINAHALFPGIMVLDQMFVATKFERRQMRASYSFSVAYFSCNIIWFLLGPEGKKVIYSPIDWGNHVEKAIMFTVGIVFIMVPVGGLIHYCVYRYDVESYKDEYNERRALRTENTEAAISKKDVEAGYMASSILPSFGNAYSRLAARLGPLATSTSKSANSKVLGKK